MHARILRENQEWILVDAPEIQIPLEIRHHIKSDDLIQEELNHTLDASKFLMRVILLYESQDKITVVLTLHHAISDGLSASA